MEQSVSTGSESSSRTLAFSFDDSVSIQYWPSLQGPGVSGTTRVLDKDTARELGPRFRGLAILAPVPSRGAPHCAHARARFT